MCSILDCYLNDCMTMQPITHLNPWILMCPMMVIPVSCVSVGIKIQIIFNSVPFYKPIQNQLTEYSKQEHKH